MTEKQVFSTPETGLFLSDNEYFAKMPDFAGL